MNTQANKRTQAEFTLIENGRVTNQWKKWFKREELASRYFDRLHLQWKGERTASMVIL